MTKETFINQLSQTLQSKIQNDGVQISAEVFTKNNDTRRYGLLVKKQGHDTVCPAIYVDRFYQSYLAKKITMDEIVDRILEILEKVRENLNYYEDFCVDPDECRDRIFYRLISRKLNRELLTKVPYIPFLDLAIVFGVLWHQSENGIESSLITEELARTWELTTAELYRCAKENTPVLFPYKKRALYQMILDYLGKKDLPDWMPEDVPDTTPQCLTNECGVHGASVILYPGLMEKMAGQIQTDFCILPSSIHEVILVAVDDLNDVENLSDMIQKVNHHVDSDEVLSDHPYFYDRKKKRFFY